jgi:hypothetical protein
MFFFPPVNGISKRAAKNKNSNNNKMISITKRIQKPGDVY